MARPRFLTATEVFDAFPALVDDVTAPPAAEPPMAYLRALASGPTPEDALTFAAYALPRREAVWWACQCVRTLEGVQPGGEDELLRAAEAWVREPDEDRRQAALRLGTETDHRAASTWLALAAAWSGGNVSRFEGAFVRPTPEQTAKAARVAILIALARVGAKERSRRLSLCVDGAVRLMQQELAGAA